MKNAASALGIDKSVIVTTKLGFRILVALNEVGVSRPILLDKYEPEAVALFKSLVKPGDRVIDVGANIGFHSLLSAQLVGPTGRVISFEPVKYLYDALITSVAENHFHDRIEAHRSCDFRQSRNQPDSACGWHEQFWRRALGRREARRRSRL